MSGVFFFKYWLKEKEKNKGGIKAHSFKFVLKLRGHMTVK
jgi:hypothetical protein